MMTTMELSGDVRAAILRVLEEYRPSEGDGVVAQASSPGISDGAAANRSSRAGAFSVRRSDNDEVMGLQDRSYPV
jgi:hypothetical protein